MNEFLTRLGRLGSAKAPRSMRVDPVWTERRVDDHRGDDLESLVLASIFSINGDSAFTETTARGLVRAAVDGSVAGKKFRDEFRRTFDFPSPIDGPEPRPKSPVDPPFPGVDIPPRKGFSMTEFERIGCVEDLTRGMARLGGLIQGYQRATPKSGASINRITPDTVAPGEVVTIAGSGFGATQGADVAVYFDGTPALVQSWSDTRVEVIAPNNVSGNICVSILEGVNSDPGALGSILGQAVEVGSVMAGCFGLDRQGGRLGSGTMALLAPRAVCGPSNHLWVGAPSIDFFLINATSSTANVRPKDSVALTWSTSHAEQVRLTAATISGSPPASLLIAARTVNGSSVLSLGASGSRAMWELEYTLTASNRAGSRNAKVRAKSAFGTSIAFLGAGTRSVFHAGALEYLPTACPKPPLAVSSTGLGALAALSAATSYGNPSALAATWEAINPPPMSPPVQNARAYDTILRLITENATVRQAFESYEHGLYADLLDSVSLALNEAMLAYADVPAIGELSITLPDTTSIIEGKVGAELTNAGLGIGFVARALDFGSIADAKMGVTTTPPHVEDTLFDLAGAGINGLGDVLKAINVPLAIAVVVAATVIKGVVRGELTATKANDLRVALAARGLFDSSALAAMLDDFTARSGLTGLTVSTSTGVALAATMLESGEPAYIDGFATAHAADGTTVAQLGWHDALLAVTAVPGALAPVMAGTSSLVDATFSDGGPLEIIARRNVDEIVVVHSTCNLLPEPGPGGYSTAGFLSLARRADRVRAASLARTSVDPEVFWHAMTDPLAIAPPRSVRHVMPTIALSNLYAFEHEVGLLDIWKDYGYLRAFDVMAPTLIYPEESSASEQLRRTMRNQLAENSDLLIGTREAIWRMENLLNRVAAVSVGPVNRRNPPQITMMNDADTLLIVRKLKTVVAEQITRRLELVQRSERGARSAISRWPGDAVPRVRYARWFGEYERHGYAMENISVIDPTGAMRVNPWLETYGFTSRPNVTAPAAAPPVVDETLFNPLP